MRQSLQPEQRARGDLGAVGSTRTARASGDVPRRARRALRGTRRVRRAPSTPRRLVGESACCARTTDRRIPSGRFGAVAARPVNVEPGRSTGSLQAGAPAEVGSLRRTSPHSCRRVAGGTPRRAEGDATARRGARAKRRVPRRTERGAAPSQPTLAPTPFSAKVSHEVGARQVHLNRSEGHHHDR